MENEKTSFDTNRRDFLGKVVSLGCLSCLSPAILCGAVFEGKKEAAGEHKFKDDSQWSFERVYKFAYASSLLPPLRAIEKEIGKERMIEIIKRAAEERAMTGGKMMGKEAGEPSLAKYNSWTKSPDRYWQHVVTYSIVEDKPNVNELNVTECIWAKTFREAKGEDIGYAIVCNSDFSHAAGYSPKLHLTRTKTLMQGNDCCNHRYTWDD